MLFCGRPAENLQGWILVPNLFGMSHGAYLGEAAETAEVAGAEDEGWRPPRSEQASAPREIGPAEHDSQVSYTVGGGDPT